MQVIALWCQMRLEMWQWHRISWAPRRGKRCYVLHWTCNNQHAPYADRKQPDIYAERQGAEWLRNGDKKWAGNMKASASLFWSVLTVDGRDMCDTSASYVSSGSEVCWECKCGDSTREVFWSALEGFRLLSPQSSGLVGGRRVGTLNFLEERVAKAWRAH